LPGLRARHRTRSLGLGPPSRANASGLQHGPEPWPWQGHEL